VCRYRSSFLSLFALVFLSLFHNIVVAHDQSFTSFNAARTACNDEARSLGCSSNFPHTRIYPSNLSCNDLGGSGYLYYGSGNTPVGNAVTGGYSGANECWGSSANTSVTHKFYYNNACDINTAQNFVDAANSESGGPVVSGPFAKPAGGYGIHVNIGYQVDNYCQFGCKMTHLTTQDVTEDDYYYQVTTSESLHVQNLPCDEAQGNPPDADHSQIINYYVPPTAERTSPPPRDPPSAPPNYPPDAPPPPNAPPPPPPDAPPPPTPPNEPCLSCDPVAPPPPVGPPPLIPPFVIKPPPACFGPNCYPPAPPSPPGPPNPNGEPPPENGCPEGTTFGSKNGLNGCYGKPKGGCSAGQFYGEVYGKEGCYGATECKDDQVWGSIGDTEPKCYDLGSCYVKGDCNQECDPETEDCDPLKGQYSKDCLVQPECGDGDAIECASLRQSWVTSCNAVQKVSGSISDCNSQFKCENDPVQCAIAQMHRDNLCGGDPVQVFDAVSTIFESHGFVKSDEFTDDDIFTERDAVAITGDFLDIDGRSGSCPPDIVLSLFGQSIVVSLSMLCTLGIYIRSFLLISASIIGLRMFYSSFVNN